MLTRAVGVPQGTLKDWLRGASTHVTATQDAAPPSAPLTSATPQCESILTAWSGWDGTFVDFCQHVQHDLRIPFSRALIADLLEVQGVRQPKRRNRTPPDTSAMRGAFETFFPGAQWVGDGKLLTIDVCGHSFLCNLELDVDVHSGAFVGASLRPTEDSAAVTRAFADGIRATGAPPLALLLDNKPSNHTDAVDEALGQTIRLRARPYTPTDKPHVEGAFGLFSQQAPPLTITATTLDELAGQIAALVVTTWARAVNHRPRADRGGRSRVQLHLGANPTPEDMARARQALKDRLRQQQRRQQTRAARQDPKVRALLDAAFTRLHLDDPESHWRTVIASWPIDAIVDGIAIFERRSLAGTLPDGVDARYLRGIVKNLAEEAEGWALAEQLLRARLAARDSALAPLEAERAELRCGRQAPELQLSKLTAFAMDAARRLDRTYWLLAAADLIVDRPAAEHRQLLRLAARRIHGLHHVLHRDRVNAVRFLFAKVVPLS